MKLSELRNAYASGKLTSPMMLDNDETFVHDENGEVFSMHPDELLTEALTLLGVPYERV